MTFPFRPLALLAAVTLSTAAHAQVTVKDAWIRATVPQQKATGAFMQLSAAQDLQLVAVTTPLTPKAEIHEMTMQDQVMRMRQIPALALPSGKAVELKPGGYHVMLLDLPRQVKAGERVPLTLVVQGKDGQRQNVQVEAEVRSLNTPSPATKAATKADPHGHGQHDDHKH